MIFKEEKDFFLLISEVCKIIFLYRFFIIFYAVDFSLFYCRSVVSQKQKKKKKNRSDLPVTGKKKMRRKN